jgi:hypothetical protein
VTIRVRITIAAQRCVDRHRERDASEREDNPRLEEAKCRLPNICGDTSARCRSRLVRHSLGVDLKLEVEKASSSLSSFYPTTRLESCVSFALRFLEAAAVHFA